MRLRKLFIITTLATVLFSFIFTNSFTNTIQPNAGRTACNIGITEQHCGTSACHNTTANTGSGSVNITFSDPDQNYVPGNTYDMTVSTMETGISKFGFEITSVTSTGDSVGTFIVPNGVTNLSKPTIGAVNHRKYLAHKNANSINTWSFQWKAPAINKGHITFFAAGNAANGNNLSSGDHIYTTSFGIDPDSATGMVAPNQENAIFTIQSIAYSQVTIMYDHSTNGRVLIQLNDVNGKIMQTFFDGNEGQGIQQHSFQLERKLSSGLYFIRYTSGIESAGAKIFIQK